MKFNLGLFLKTNISFGCEIEGTIKAQVPKSLGATVNTHTEQINNLNKELDRVKKLEESTVSTVTTESDFTTVEATSNGYFEDVKLEGKTLVNKFFESSWGVKDVIDSKKVLKFAGYVVPSNGSPHENCLVLMENPQEGIYTIVGKFKKTTYWNKVKARFSDGTTVLLSDLNDNFELSVVTFNIKSGCTHLYIDTGASDAFGYVEEKSLILLEGDHTQNPPSFFEGLKSVGQSATTSEDGVDEIVVSSVNENLFDVNEYRKKENWTGSTSYKAFKIQLKPNTKYTFNRYDYCGNGLNIYVNIGDIANSSDVKKNIWVCHSTISSYVNKSNEFITNETGVVYINTYLATNSNDSDLFEKVFKEFSIYEGTTPKPYTPHQSDKKRLLYYNEETQAWEKPILREWDSIEKHADGKYYYHQRSGEVVLNGSENWVGQTQIGSLNTRYISFNEMKRFNNYNGQLICDKMTVLNSYAIEQEGISAYTNIGAYVGQNWIYINTNKTTDELKTWLQANNVTVVYQLAQEKVYECTNIDLITYNGETNFIVESGAIVPKTTLKVHNNISNVVSLLQKKVSLLESNMTKYMITQNRLQLSSTHSADSVTFKVDYTVCSENMSQENYDTDLYNLILNNILVGKDNYDYDHMFNIIMDYASWSQISWDQFDILVGLMDIQHNPPIEEIPTDDEIVEEIPNEIM